MKFILFLKLICLLPFCAFANSQEEKLQFYAYSEEVENNFNKECILCTPSDDYKATIAFTKHWKITYWMNQAYLGRSLIISQRHFGTYEEMNDEEALEYREILKRFLPALQKTFGTTHFNVAYLMNQAYRKEKADPPFKDGKPSPHFHWHIIPRYDGIREFDGITFEDPNFGDSFDFSRKQYLEGEFQKKAIKAIRENLGVVYVPLPDRVVASENSLFGKDHLPELECPGAESAGAGK
jgi:diadenosine tetraphosphate (Ap4A) HIT family hydrolase